MNGLILTCVILGICFWIFGIYSLFYIWLIDDTSDTEEKFKFTIALIIIFGCLGLAANVPSFVSMEKDIKTSYILPHSIIKTNDIITVVLHDGKAFTESFMDAKYYNSTNIMVRKMVGNNLWGKRVDDIYKIGIYTNAVTE